MTSSENTDEKTVGAWLVHHAQKLASVEGTGEFENITAAGKSIILLSSLAESESESTLDRPKVEAVATACKISKRFELPILLDILQKQKLIDVGKSGGISVIGITTESALMHGAKIFQDSGPSPSESAAIELAERSSSAPIRKSAASKLVSDTFKLTPLEANEFLDLSSASGLVDREGDGNDDDLFFNGNLFRRGEAGKAALILSSLTAAEGSKVKEIEERISKQGCAELDVVKSVLGDRLWGKLHAIGYFDLLKVENSKESVLYVSRPASFSKYGNSMIEDALDLAKAFSASLAYGMTRSEYGRGKISMINALMRKLIRKEWVGPATAIGQDYQILETRRVIELKHDSGSMYYMRLLKPEIGEIALAALTTGVASELAATKLSGASITKFEGPEQNRFAARKTQIKASKKETQDILDALRTGG